jgi:hypothetical protein
MLSNSTDGRRRAIAACHSFKAGYVIQALGHAAFCCSVVLELLILCTSFLETLVTTNRVQ